MAMAAAGASTAKPPPLPEALGSLLDSLADAAVLVERDGRILYFNDQAEKALALSRTLVLGHRFAEVFETNAWLIALLERTLATAQTHSDRNALLRFGPDLTGHHGELPVSATLTPWRDAAGGERGALALLADRSRLSALERDLIRSDRLASLGTIAAGLAHEIKNPLGGIKGAAQLLLREGPEPAARELVEVVIKEAERVNGILETLLRFGRPPRPATEAVNLHAVIDEVIRLVSLSESGKGERFELCYDPSLPPVRGSADALKQVFLNLIQNAAEANGPGGRTEIITRYATDMGVREGPGEPIRGFVQISVRDEGLGITPENLSRLFTPFFTTKDRGTGLGLVMSHQIVKEHGGFLTVESALGKGSTFVVHLPRGETP